MPPLHCPHHFSHTQWLAGVLLAFAAASALAAPDPVASPTQLAVFHDATGKLTRGEVASSTHASRFRAQSGPLHTGYSKGAWWLRLRYPASTYAEQRAWLWVRVRRVATAQLWLSETRGGQRVWHMIPLGMSAPARADVRYVGQGAAVRLPANVDGGSAYLRLVNPRPIMADLVAWSGKQFRDELAKHEAATGATLTIVVFLLVASLVMAGVLREWMYAAFGLQLVAMLALTLASTQAFGAWLAAFGASAAVTWLNYSDALVLFSTLFLGYTLLELKAGFPRVARVLRWVMAASVLGLIPAALGAGGVLSRLALIEGVLANVLFIVLAAIRCRQHKPLAAWLFIAYLFGGGGTIVYVLQSFGWWNAHGSGLAVVHAAPAVFAIVVIIVLAVRARRATLVAGQVLAQAAEESRTEALRLEQIVSQRTASLHAALDDHHNLLTMVSHELRTPLAIIDASAQFLENLQPTPDERRETDKIRRGTRRLIDLVGGLLADAKLGGVTLQPQLVRLSLDELLAAACSQCHQATGRRFERTDLSGTAGGTYVMGDATLLRVVLDNLLDNAVKYSPGDQPVEISIASSTTTVTLHVRDHGGGISADALQQLFDRYYRAEDALKRPGIGFGLYIAHRIVERHGGSLTAANVTGGGAVFTLSLPVAA